MNEVKMLIIGISFQNHLKVRKMDHRKIVNFYRVAQNTSPLFPFKQILKLRNTYKMNGENSEIYYFRLNSVLFNYYTKST